MSAPAHDDLQDLAAAYVLGTLSARTRNEVEQRLPADAALRAEVAAWEARLLPLTALAEPVEPSAALWSRIERSTAPAATTRAPAARAIRGPGRSTASWWESLNFWRFTAAVGHACALLLAVVMLHGAVTRTEAPTQYLVVLVAPDNRNAGWVIQASADGALSLVPMADTPVPPGRSLQFWTKADDWSGPRSLGLVEPGRTLRVNSSQLPPLQPNQLFELTLEPAAGSPIDRPTGPILFIGRAVPVRS
jgi:anti-sigma-K factor RskA